MTARLRMQFMRSHLLRTSLACLVVLIGLAWAGWWYRVSRPEYRLRQGREALDLEKFDRAEGVAAALEASGSVDLAQLLRGESFLRQKRYRQAVQAFNQIRDQGEIRRQAIALSSQCFLFLKDYPEAERTALFVLAEEPDNLDAHRVLASVYYDLGGMWRALGHLKEWARLDPGDGRPFRFMAFIYADVSHLDDLAVEACREALKRQLTEQVAEEVRQELAQLLIKQAKYDEALAVLRDAVAEEPKVAVMRAECLWTKGQTAEARRLAEDALKVQSSCGEALRLLGQIHWDGRDFGPAAASLEKAVQLDPNDYASRHLLAQTYERLGRNREAGQQRQLLQRTQTLLEEQTELSKKAMEDPWDEEVRLRLADINRKLQRPEQAASWERAARACAVKKKARNGARAGSK